MEELKDQIDAYFDRKFEEFKIDNNSNDITRELDKITAMLNNINENIGTDLNFSNDMENAEEIKEYISFKSNNIIEIT